MSGGAVVAAAAAAHRRRINHVLDAFRVAGATAPDRARALDTLVPARSREVDELQRAGVLVASPRGDSWYLDERAYVAWRDAGMSRRARALLLIAVLLLAIGLAIALSIQRAP